MLRENEIIFNVLLTINQFKGRISNLRQSVLSDSYCQSNHYSRLLVWKVCLITDSLNIQNWDEKLHNTRIVYAQLMKRADLVVPWELLSDENAFYVASTKVAANNDPLNDGQMNGELLNNITLDIERLFPGNEFFNGSTVESFKHKKALVQILYIWAKCNPSIGYKQGFHEILGLIYLNLYRESVPIPNTNTMSKDDLNILKLYNIKYLVNDVFVIFNKFILESGFCSNFYENEQALLKSVSGFNALLMKVDQLIYYVLINKLKLESQLWVIRYWRLLLSRELGSLEVASNLWDKMVVLQPISSLPVILNYMVIVLLIHIKSELLSSDFSEALSTLLHFPVEKVAGRYTSTGSFVSELIKDALGMYERKDNDLKLYEYGVKLNSKYNPNIKVTINHNGKVGGGVDKAKQDQMKFEKLRLEMRLKKRAQEMVKKS